MGTPTSIERWQRVDRLERSVCLRINRLSRHGPSRQFFATVSRLGDGPIWYLLMFVLAVSGEQTAGIAAQMAVTGIAGTLLYRVLKEDERARLVANIAGHLGGATRDVQRRQLRHFLRADVDYGTRVAKALGLAVEDALA